jgi:hypothetical protein
MASGDLILAWCGRDVTAWFEAPVEMENSVMGPGIKAAHRGVNRARMLGEYQHETLATKADCIKGWVHKIEGALCRNYSKSGESRLSCIHLAYFRKPL